MRGQLSDLDALFESIRAQLADLSPESDAHQSLFAHLRHLALGEDEPMDYPDPGAVAFPETMPVAYAVCHPECGAREFIVDGSTQECQYCGGLMFRTEVREYVLRDAAT